MAGQKDQVFKELLKEFFPDFIELFYPQIAAQLDWSTLRFLDKETFTDFPRGEQHEADIVTEVKTHEGTPELILVHVEIESRRRPVSFPERMRDYYFLLRRRYSLPILPIVLYLSPGAGGLVVETVRESLFGLDILTFHYLAVGLPDLEAQDYEAKPNPLGAVLSAWMRSTETRKVVRWLRVLRRLVALPLNPAQQALAASVVELGLPLTKEEQMELQQQTDQEPEVSEMTTIFERWGLEKGLEQGLEQGLVQGREQGVQEGLKAAVLRLATLRFGSLSEPIQQRILGMTSDTELNGVLERVLTAPTPEGLFTN
ncbi:hypothetical protein [Armatimonas rosea]|uniref:Putative transposase YdaD n=1 Tax=Armatimonas rosea TaxID=685828 RepID=A0A7W9W9S2_ARMRO|nr:hypothetical protein [Armatimonas rosea]MBB6053596.1 putative transposase YdaD [Armatimonas rosea]